MCKIFDLVCYAHKNARNKRGDTPLHRAALAGSFEVLSLLLEEGADKNQVHKLEHAAEQLVRVRGEPPRRKLLGRDPARCTGGEGCAACRGGAEEAEGSACTYMV